MFKKSIALVYFLSAAFFISAVQAAIIFYNGHSGYSYSLNTSTNVITTNENIDNQGELQWLRWDETEACLYRKRWINMRNRAGGLRLAQKLYLY